MDMQMAAAPIADDDPCRIWIEAERNIFSFLDGKTDEKLNQ